MSLYHEAAQVLTSAINGKGSLKSIVFSKKDWKTDRRLLFALSAETAKWSQVLAEVLERSELLVAEKTLTPVLALVLGHDFLLSKKGIALPAKHGLHASVARHKARLTSELTKARLRRGRATLDALRAQVNGVASTAPGYNHPRWIRINTLGTTMEKELATTFKDFVEVFSMPLMIAPNVNKARLFHRDEHVPNLIAVPGNVDLAASEAYKEGRLIFQEKASCFPAYLLDPSAVQGDLIDGCAAPGNKTTHLAALVSADNSTRRTIFACEKDAARSQTLTKMVNLAAADKIVRVKVKQDFMRLRPEAAEFAKVQALLLDPSCSGSGIVGRDEATVTIHLPSRDKLKPDDAKRGKKRKRAPEVKLETAAQTADTMAEEEETSVTTADEDATKLAARLQSLSAFQLKLLEHAMAFSAAKRITYSTCSLHKEENEHVVARALCSAIARSRRWRILRRDEQAEGLQAWKLRGTSDAVREVADAGQLADTDEVSEACIRCEKGGEGGTMGFFVAGFVRDDDSIAAPAVSNGNVTDTVVDGVDGGAEHEDEEDEWSGFSDSDT